jgi:hypothetical protein
VVWVARRCSGQTGKVRQGRYFGLGRKLLRRDLDDSAKSQGHGRRWRLC